MIVTVFQKADQLIKDHGFEHAEKYFQDKIDEFGEPTNFSQLCKKSGLETALDYIKGLKIEKDGKVDAKGD